MKLKSEPNNKIRSKIKLAGWKLNKEGNLWFAASRCVAVLNGDKRFIKAEYLGTMYARKRSLSQLKVYRFYKGLYSGDLLRAALTVLKRKKIWTFVANLKDQEDYQVLLLGTEEATVAIAPRVIADSGDGTLYDYEPLSKSIKLTKKLMRICTFEEI